MCRFWILVAVCRSIVLNEVDEKISGALNILRESHDMLGGDWTERSDKTDTGQDFYTMIGQNFQGATINSKKSEKALFLFFYRESQLALTSLSTLSDHTPKLYRV